eukprot:TRINITY_DN5071_c0_g3_i1.p1 TRINITY_DN5071_c0_g3~~TRINITY_DN5071_c0_g3_i1.p1  ORF type:complete len:702 (-),score=48.15 TRINITY_DN5071_c0_g3_i1:156-2261(-)
MVIQYLKCFLTTVLTLRVVQVQGSDEPCSDMYGMFTSPGLKICDPVTTAFKKCVHGNWIEDGICTQSQAYCTAIGVNNHYRSRYSMTNAVALHYCCHQMHMFDCSDLPASAWTNLVTTGVVLFLAGLACISLSYLDTSPWIAWRRPLLPEVSADPGKMLDGVSMHERVPAHRWCVTREDLEDFKRRVQDAVSAGRIVPTKQDQFDPNDLRIGPSVYTVNEQYITPVTEAAGKMSWALMLHPDGIDCDIFITHAWREGVYELVDAVIHSWPSGMKGAYCCVLSNPQNLDISRLISSPDQSPFALALRAARCILAVPNHSESIYARLWCAFEAYLAYSLDKPIYTARAPIPHLMAHILHSAGLYLVSMGALLSLTSINTSFAVWNFINIACQASTICALAVFFVVRPMVKPDSFTRYIFKKLFIILGGFFFASDALVQPYHVSSFASLALISLALVCSLEVGRLRSISAMQQATMLHRGFTGHVIDAQCSRPDDANRIRKFIQNEEDQVDAAVSVLIEMGMSTSYLRLLREQVGCLGSQVAWSSFLSLMMPGTFIVLQLTFMERTALWSNPCLWLSVGEGVTWVLVFCFLSTDRKKFAVGVAGGVSTACTVSYLINLFILNQGIFFRHGFVLDFWSLGIVFPILGGPTALVCSCVGPRYVARLPLVGKLIVRSICGSPSTHESVHSSVGEHVDKFAACAKEKE